MYRFNLSAVWRIIMMIGASLFVVGLAACGSDGDADVVADVVAASSAVEEQEDSVSGADDHDDDDSADEDHDDDDHDDEDHDDEDHDDEDHDDEDHDDEDHDDHDDEDHDDEGSSGLGAHVHGEAELSVAWSGGDVVIDLISPTESIFGFEYEPTTDEDVAFAADRTQALTADGVLVFNAEAACSRVGEPTTDVVFEGSHAEITASWVFTCDSPDQIAELDAGTLFAEFPGLVDVDAQWVSDTRQSAGELTPSSTVLRLE